MTNPVITDVLEAGLYFTSESDVEIKRDDVIVDPSKYTVKFTADKKEMVITFNDKPYKLLGSYLKVTYNTSFDVRDLIDLQIKKPQYCNSVKVEFESERKVELESEKKENKIAETKICVDPKKEQLENGQKLGAYDYKDKVIKWNVFSNFNENELVDAVLVDTLTDGLVFPKDVKFTYYLYYTDIDATVKYVGEKVALTEDEVKDYIDGVPVINAARNEVTFKFKDGTKDKDGRKNAQIEIEFETPVGPIIKDKFKNKVEFTNGGRDYAFEKEVTIVNGGHLGKKYPDRSVTDDLIKWVIEVNFSQSTVSGYTIDDLMSENQIMIWTEENKPVLYDGVVEYNAAGNKGKVSKGEKSSLLDPEDYTIVPHPGMEEDGQLVAKNGFQLKFNKDISKPYILEYYTLPNFGADGNTTIENTIKISGASLTFATIPEDQTEVITFNTSSGGAFASLTKVDFVKYDQFDNEIEGIEFRLTSPHTPQFEKRAKSDANGIVSFDRLTKGEYLLTELIESQEPEIKDGLVGHIGLVKGAETKILTSIKDPRDNTIYNWNHNVMINKIDGLKKTPIPNTEFTLFIMNADGDYVFDKKGETDSDGKLKFDRLLKEGKYKLIESKAAPGFVLDTALVAYFDIKDEDVEWIKSPSNEEGGAGNLDPRVCAPGTDLDTATKDDCSLSNHTFNFENYRGDVNFNKTDSKGMALAGAEFEIIHEDPVSNPGPYRATSDIDGSVVFNNIPVGNYTLKEINVLAGYLENTEEIKFTVIAQSNGKPQPMGLDDFINYKGSAEFMKVDEEGRGLAGAVFEATHENGEIFTATSMENGMVTFTDLLAGLYTVQEISPAPGYLRNTKTFTFEVSNTTKGKALPVSDIEDYVNYKASVAFNKVDLDGNPVAGSLFHLSNDNEIYTAISDENGYVFFANVRSGDYVLSEEIAGGGFFVNTVKRDVIVDGEYDGQELVIELEDFVNYKGSLEFIKTDAQGNGLEGAEFTLTHNEIDNKEYKASSNELGLVVFEDLEAGSYSLKETKAPQGYLLNKDIVMVDLGLTAENEPSRLEIEPIVNYKNTVEVKKVDKNENILKGAEFKLLKDGLETDIEMILTDGEILLTDLEIGEYQLIETKAPVGYKLDPKPIEFTIHDGSLEPLEGIEIQVVNHLLPRAIKADKPKTPVPSPDILPPTGLARKLPFLGISLLSLGTYLLLQKSKKKDESEQ